jgi:hypothetical protein
MGGMEVEEFVMVERGVGVDGKRMWARARWVNNGNGAK